VTGRGSGSAAAPAASAPAAGAAVGGVVLMVSGPGAGALPAATAPTAPAPATPPPELSVPMSALSVCRLELVSLPAWVSGKDQLCAAFPGLSSHDSWTSLPFPDLAFATPPTRRPWTWALWIFFQSGFFLVKTRLEATQL